MRVHDLIPDGGDVVIESINTHSTILISGSAAAWFSGLPSQPWLTLLPSAVPSMTSKSLQAAIRAPLP